MESFIEEAAVVYHLDLFHCPPPDEDEHRPHHQLPVESVNGVDDKAKGKAKGGEGMRRALELYKEKFPHVDAVLVGTRRGDPHGGALLFLRVQSFPVC